MSKKHRKHILFIIDGASDQPLTTLQGKTPLQAAHHPTMDHLAATGKLGLSQTIPTGFAPGTDGAFLTLFGYAGGALWSRGALEAAGLGLDVSGYANVLRCNLVGLSPEGTLLSHNGFDVADDHAEALVAALLQDDAFQQCLQSLGARLLPGRGFRQLIGTENSWPGLWAPHDHLGEPPPAAPTAWRQLLERATQVMQDCCRELGVGRPVNGIWPWGGGPCPALPQLTQRFGVDGCCVSAVPVVHGIARMAGLNVLDIPGATGRLDTAWQAKVRAALGCPEPFVLLHLEAPDECAHEKDAPGKVQAIELADAMLEALLAGLQASNTPHRLLVMADHGTSTQTGKHLTDPVPYVLYNSADGNVGAPMRFTEADAAQTGQTAAGHCLLGLLMQGE